MFSVADSESKERHRTSVAHDCHNRNPFVASKPLEELSKRCATGTDCHVTASARVSLSVTETFFLAANTESRSRPAEIADPRQMTDDKLDSNKVTFCELNILLVLSVCPTTSHFE